MTGMRVERKRVELTVAQVRGLHRRHTYRAEYVDGAIRVALESAITCRATQLCTQHRTINIRGQESEVQIPVLEQTTSHPSVHELGF
jgi:hypothetical protein